MEHYAQNHARNILVSTTIAASRQLKTRFSEFHSSLAQYSFGILPFRTVTPLLSWGYVTFSEVYKKISIQGNTLRINRSDVRSDEECQIF